MARRYRPTLSDRLNDLHTEIGHVSTLASHVANLAGEHRSYDAETVCSLLCMIERIAQGLDRSMESIIPAVENALRQPVVEEPQRAAG